MEADQKLNLDKEEQNFVQNYVRPPQIPLTIQTINDQLDLTF